MPQITTISFFKYPSLTQKFWAFKMMRDAHPYLNEVRGMVFYKLMGSGRGLGFNPWPDWSVYSLLQIWEDESQANAFFAESELMQQYREHASEHWTLYMKSIQSKGEWSGNNPFFVHPSPDLQNPYIAVITRATIRPSKLISFWRYVPTSQKPIEHCPGLLYTKGIGEAPIVQMATFSLWDSEAALKQFAYQSAEHQEAIKRTRKLNWYKEELFSRFQPYRSLGSWEGIPELFKHSLKRNKQKTTTERYTREN